MTDPLLRDALRLIQDIVAESTGARLDREAIRRLEEVLERVGGADASQPADTGYSQREATILFADLRGFSAIAASYPAEVVLGVLSRCFGLMTEIVVRHYGTIDKFMGDAIMVVFHGDDSSSRDHAQRALLCAVEMQIGMNALRQQHREDKLPEIYIGIGISTGAVMAGLIGSDAYRAYTVIGEEVNLAARIEAFSLRGQVLMSEATYAHCAEFVQTGEPMEVHVKGKSERLRIREVLAIPGLGKVVPRQEVRKSPRVAVTLELECWALDGKTVRAGASRALVRDIGYHGLLAELEQPFPLYSELKLSFAMPCVDFLARDVYGRIVSLRESAGRFRAGIEFTSLDALTEDKIRLFVQMCIQGECDAAQMQTAASGRPRDALENRLGG